MWHFCATCPLLSIREAAQAPSACAPPRGRKHRPHVCLRNRRKDTWRDGLIIRAIASPSRFPVFFRLPLPAMHVCRCLGEDSVSVTLPVDEGGDGATTPSRSV